MDLFKELQDTIETKTPLAEDEVAAPKKIIGNTDFFRKFTNQGTDLKQMSNRDAANIVQQAHDDTEEVDTVAFGLETNEGDIVKVYVNAEQADDFEKAMADALGQEDDIEECIDKMAQSFDIVSVEWPEERMGGAAPQPGANQTPNSIVPAENEEAEDEQSGLLHKVKLSFNLADKSEKAKGDNGEEDSGEEDSEEEKDGGMISGKEEGGQEEDDLGLGDFGTGEEDTGEEDTGEEELDADGKPIKKKKKKKVEEQLSIGARLKARYLGEDAIKAKGSEGTGEEEEEKTVKSKGVDDLEQDKKKADKVEVKKDKTDVKLEDIFKTPMQQKIFKLIMLFDFPSQRLIQHKQEVRSGIRNVSIHVMSNNKARLFLSKLIKEMEANIDLVKFSTAQNKVVKAHKAQDLEESTEGEVELEQLNKQIDNIIKLVQYLGIPEIAISTRETALRLDLRKVARIIVRHSMMQSYMKSLIKAFEDAQDREKETIKEEVELGASQYATLVSKLLSGLGVPDDNLNYQRSTLITSLRNKTRQINIAAVKPRIIQLLKILAATQPEQVQEALLTEVDIFVKQHAAKLGNWSIAKMDKRVSLSVEDVSIELNANNTERLISAMEEGDSTTVKAGAKHYKFKAVNNGKEYVVFLLDDEQHEHGVLFNRSAVKNLLNQF